LLSEGHRTRVGLRPCEAAGVGGWGQTCKTGMHPFLLPL